MKRIALSAVCAMLLLGACKKEDPQPPVATTKQMKFTFTSDAAITMDSMETNYKNATGNWVKTMYYNTGSWSSPVMTFNVGDQMQCTVKAWGKTTAANPYASLNLVNAADNGIITAVGSKNLSGGIFTFTGEINRAL